MNDKEKKAIEKIEKQILIGECEKAIGVPIYISDLKIVLNLLEKQKAEIEEKDKSLKLHKKLEYQYKNDYLNVIEDLKKKDKEIKCLKCLHNTQVEIIDLMANNLIGVVFSDNDNKEILFDNKEDVKKYFENKEEESK